MRNGQIRHVAPVAYCVMSCWGCGTSRTWSAVGGQHSRRPGKPVNCDIHTASRFAYGEGWRSAHGARRGWTCPDCVRRLEEERVAVKYRPDPDAVHNAIVERQRQYEERRQREQAALGA